MFMSLSKTESVSLHLSGQQNFPPLLKNLFTDPTINEHISLKVNYNYYYYYLNIEII